VLLDNKFYLDCRMFQWLDWAYFTSSEVVHPCNFGLNLLLVHLPSCWVFTYCLTKVLHTVWPRKLIQFFRGTLPTPSGFLRWRCR